MLSDELNSQLLQLLSARPSSNDGKNIFAPFLTIFQEFLESLTCKFDEFKTEMLAISSAKDEEISVLRNEISTKDTMITSLKNQLDSQDQYVRRESLVFSGSCLPAWKKDENCNELMCRLIPEKLGTDIVVNPSDISIAHRLGPKPRPGKEDRRSIIVRFCRRNLKYTIINKSRSAKRKDFYVNESLTPTRLKIVRSLKKAKLDHPNIMSGYQTVDGSIFVWVKPPNPDAEGASCSRVKINTIEELEVFCQRNFEQPASHYFPRRHEATQDDSSA